MITSSTYLSENAIIYQHFAVFSTDITHQIRNFNLIL